VAKKGKFPEGNYGAGAGATAAGVKGGLGTASIKVGDTGVVVGAMAAVNAAGNPVDPKSRKVLAAEDRMARIRAGVRVVQAPPGQNTTIAVVATNAAFNKAEINKIAQMANSGLARAINPNHWPGDGDAVYALSTGTLSIRASVGAIGALAAEALAEAVVRGVMHAEGIPGRPSYRDLLGQGAVTL
jgi:L-aminopeptidase/D-esterase-like protein